VPGSTSFPFIFNPLDLGTIDREYQQTYLRQIIELFLDCYLDHLQLLTVHGVEYLLLLGVDELLAQKGTFTFHDLYGWLKRFRGKHREREWKTTALDLLYKLITGPLGKVMQQTSKGVDWLIGQRAILELNNVGSSRDKSFLVRTLLLRLYYHVQQQGPTRRMRLFIVLEEAHNILLRKTAGCETIIELMLRQIREFGVGICVVDQHPSLMSLPALGTYGTVSFNLRLRQDREAMASALSLEQKEYLGRLPPRYAIVKIQNRFMTPFLIRTFDVKTDPPPVKRITDRSRKREEGIRVVRNGKEDIRGFSEVLRADSDVVRVIRRTSNERRKPLFWEEVFLVHIYVSPMMGAVERYRKLGLNEYQGNKHRTSLLDKGLIAMESVALQRGRIKVMVPTRKGFSWLKERGFVTSSDKEGSIEHQYWKLRLRERFRGEGFAVEMEVPLGDNMAIDLVVTDGNRRVSVEVETGKNSCEQIKKNIAKGINHADGVVCLILNNRVSNKIDAMVKVARAVVTADEGRCIEVVTQLLKGDAC